MNKLTELKNIVKTRAGIDAQTSNEGSVSVPALSLSQPEGAPSFSSKLNRYREQLAGSSVLPFPIEKTSLAPLGKDSEITQPPPSVSFNNKDLSKWDLQKAATIALGSSFDRLASCHRTLIGGNVSVNRHIETGNMHYGGLATCGSVWSCPVCAPKITEHKRIEMTEALDNARKLGLAPSMLSLTAPHKRGDKLKDCLRKISHALGLMKNRKPWKRLMKDLKGSIRALEVTYGVNGWHVHFHIILFLDEWKKTLEASEILPMWQAACLSAGLESPNEHGVDITLGDEKIGDYLTKWGLESEMTKSMIKKGMPGSGNLTPWDLLRGYASTGDEDYGDLFREYSKCFKGRHQLEWSRGLRAFLGLGEEKTDEEIADEKIENSALVCLIPLEVWRVVIAKELRGQVLKVASEGVTAITEYLERMTRGET